MSSATKRYEYDVFVSYAHKDDHDGWVSALVAAIEAEHLEFATVPLGVFFDRGEIRAMDDWEHRILRGLRHSKVMIAVLSPAYFASAYCRKEWEIHLDHELDRSMPGEGLAPIYTVAVPDFEGEAPAALERWVGNLKRRQYFDVRDWRTSGVDAFRRDDVRRRLKALDHHLNDKIAKAERVASSPSTIPPHNPQFVGRIDELRTLREALSHRRIGAIAALHGIGGIGKSALAFEYAHAYADDYPGGRYLVPCSTTIDLRIPIVGLAEYKGIEFTPDERKDLDACFARVRAKFEAGPRSLLLLDNVDDPALIAPNRLATTLPRGDNVHVMITTRVETDRLTGIDAVSLDSLPDVDALALLAKYRPIATDADRDAASRIVRRLGGHPLALEVVAVSLKQSPGITYSGYASRLDREGLAALEGTARDDRVALSRHDQKLVSALLEPTLATLSPEELLVMEYAALLPPDRVPIPWLRTMASQSFLALAADPDPGYEPAWDLTLRRLLGLRLLIRSDLDGFVRIHRLLADVLGRRMGEALDDRREALTAFIRSRAIFLREGWSDRAVRWEIDPIANFAGLLLDGAQVEPGVDLANGISSPLRELGRYIEDRALLRRAVGIGTPKLGEDHPTLAASYSNLAAVEQDLGDLSAARRLFLKAIAIDEKAYEPDHPALAINYSNLGMLELDLGDLPAARRLLLKAIAIDEKAYEPDHPALAIRYSHLGIVEKILGDLPAARRLLMRAMAIDEKVYEPDHPTLASRYSNLGLVEKDLGDLLGARHLLLKAVAIGEKAYEPEHPSLALFYSNLATVEQKLGDLPAARRLILMSVTIKEKVYGQDHHSLALSYSNLAAVELGLGNVPEARRLLLKAIAIDEKAYQPDHPMLATCYWNLGKLEENERNMVESSQWVRKAYQIWAGSLGVGHAHTNMAAGWLAKNRKHGPMNPTPADRIRSFFRRFWK